MDEPKRRRLQKLPPETLQDVDEWAKRIRGSWNKAVESIIETGRLLLRAKEELGHGKFGEMIDGELPFGRRTAQCLMAIASHPVLSNPQYVAYLPPSWGTLYDLTALPADRLVDLIEETEVTPDLQRHEVKVLGVDHLERVPGAFNTLFALMKRYPNPVAMMTNLTRIPLERWKPIRRSAVGSMEELPEWITKLAAAWNREREKEYLEQEEERKYQREEQEKAWARIQEAIDRKAAREEEEKQKSAPKRPRPTR